MTTANLCCWLALTAHLRPEEQLNLDRSNHCQATEQRPAFDDTDNKQYCVHNQVTLTVTNTHETYTFTQQTRTVTRTQWRRPLTD